MHSFCLLASMELILISNCSLLHLYSNDMNSLKVIKIIIIIIDVKSIMYFTHIEHTH